MQVYKNRSHMLIRALPPTGHRGRDDMVVGFKTTNAISAYHH
jgi:hypothetical protein